MLQYFPPARGGGRTKRNPNFYPASGEPEGSLVSAFELSLAFSRSSNILLFDNACICLVGAVVVSPV